MDTFDKKLSRAIEEDPGAGGLSQLKGDVWEQIRKNEDKVTGWALWDITFTPGLKVLSLALILGSALALSQVKFNSATDPDFFDLRYFSQESLATTYLLSDVSQGGMR